MYSLNSFYQNWTYNNNNNNNNNTDCYFAICKTCFWTATIFNSVKKWNKYDNNSHKRSIRTCPLCSSKNISMISIPTWEWYKFNMQIPCWRLTNTITRSICSPYWSAKRKMSHKGSCRACGSSLTPIAVCKICKEYISWVCNRCDNIEDVTHMHREFIEDVIR